MALVLKDRVKELTSTTGTGAVTLGGPIAGFQGFSSIGDSNLTYYTIVDTDTGAWEVGYGTYTSSGSTLSRDFVYASSNANALVDFGAGTKEVFVTYPAEQAIYQETNGSLKLVGGTIGLTQDGTEGTTLPNTSFQAFTTGNYYMQANQQNLSSGAEASSDWVATADNGTDTEFYMDMGMASSGYNFPDFSAFKANSGYILSTGADLRIVAGKFGAVTPGAQDIVFVAGSLKDTEERGRIAGLTGNWVLDGLGAADTGEKLQVYGAFKTTGAATFGSTVTLHQDPTLALEAATKQYVDNAVAAGLTIHDPVRLEATTNLTATYDNGTSGVGATLTNADTQTALILDGVAVAVNDRVLIYLQADATQNGIYTVTDIGSGATNWVLTRATDADSYNANDPDALEQGSYFYVQEGDTAAGESYVCNNVGTITFGTTGITFVQFSASPTFTGVDPIDVTGQTISLTGVVSPIHGGTGLSSFTTGDLTYSNATNTLTKLPIGTTGQALIVSGSVPAWGAVNLAGAGVSGVLPEVNGGTNQGSYAIGDLLYSGATNTLTKLAGNTTTAKQYLSQTGTGSASAAPSWAAVAAADITGLAPSATTDTTNAANITTGALPSGRLIGGYTGVTAVGTLVGLDVSDSTTITANTTSDALRITQTGTGNALLVEDSASPDSTPVVITSTGYLVVGYTNAVPASMPNNKLIQSHSVQGGAGYTATRWDATANGPQLLFGKSRGGAVGTLGIVAANDSLGQIVFSGDDGVDLVTSGAQIAALVDGTPGTNAMPGRLVFSTTADGASVPTERMRIDSAGNVGIGTTAITNSKLRLGGDITGSTTSYGLFSSLNVQPDVTSRATMYVSSPTTAVGAAPTILTHYYATQGAFSGTPTAQYGFEVTSALTGATNNYGFHSGIAAGTGRYNFYAAGTADNYFAGNVLLGTTTARETVTTSGVASTPTFQNAGNTQAASSAALLNYSTATSGSYLNLSKSKSGTVGTHTAVIANDDLGAIVFSGSDGSAFDSAAYIFGEVDGAVSSGSVPGRLTFATTAVGDTSPTERMRITSTGGLALGTTADPGAGAIFATGNVTAFYSSDRRLKENVRDIPNALDKVSAIGGKNFDWTDEYIAEHGGANDYFLRKADFGVIAQDVEAVFPEAVRTRDNGMLAVDYEKLCALAFAAISELRKEVEELKKGK